MTRAVRNALFVFMIPCSLAAFSLAKQDVFPRVFTPNGDGINDVVYFNVANPSLDTMEGKIFAVDGTPVAGMKKVSDVFGAANPPLQPDALMWDGKDGNGNTVRAGIYIYEVSGGGQKFTGTVVVAK